MSAICVIPSDDDVGLTERNSKRRVIFLAACHVCGEDYDVRNGKFLRTKDQTGDNFDIRVCPNCFRDKEELIRQMIDDGKKLLF